MRPLPQISRRKLEPAAAGLAAGLPPLLARAYRLADAVAPGEQGRRQPGQGDAFWQYRPARPGDPARAIDWRRSARSDQHFVQEKEWQAAQTVMFWVDSGAAMRFSSAADLPAKVERAALVALALAVLLVRGGEQVGMAGLAPGRGQVQLARLAQGFERGLEQGLEAGAAGPDHAAPQPGPVPGHGRAVLVSDFLGDLAPLEATLAGLADRGVRGAMVMVLDPAEEDFPFEGRTIFESMTGAIRFETRHAGALRERYQARLKARKVALVELAAGLGWQFHVHHTVDPAAGALLWLYHALEGRV